MGSIYLSSLALNQKIYLCKQDTDPCVHIVILTGGPLMIFFSSLGPKSLAAPVPMTDFVRVHFPHL